MPISLALAERGDACRVKTACRRRQFSARNPAARWPAPPRPQLGTTLRVRIVTDHIETEFKLRSSIPLEVAVVDAALRELGVVVRSSAAIQHEDHYLDDDRGSLRVAGIGLRLRERDGRRELTTKTRGSSVDGRFVRHELEVAWAGSRPPQTAAELPPPLRDRIEPFVLDRPLRPFLRLWTARDLRRIGGGDAETSCELTVDRVRAEAGEHRAAFDEIELEVVGDAPSTERLALALRERLPLHAALLDKPTYACDLLGLPLPATPELDATTPLGVALPIVMSRHLQALRHAEAGVRGDGGSEALHTMRVAVRRLRSLVRAFTDLWSATDGPRLQELLTTLGRRLGVVRDLDVLLGTLDEHLARLPDSLRSAGQDLERSFGEVRRLANDELLAWLRSDDCRQRQGELEALLPKCVCGPAGARCGGEVPARLSRAATRLQKRVQSIDPNLPAGPMHELRIASKRLRYLAEEFAIVTDAALAKPLRKISVLQLVLGTVRDQDSLAERLLHELSPPSAIESPWRAAAIGALVMRASQAAAKARKRASKALGSADKKRVWKAFVLDAASTEDAPAPTDDDDVGAHDQRPAD